MSCYTCQDQLSGGLFKSSYSCTACHFAICKKCFDKSSNLCNACKRKKGSGVAAIQPDTLPDDLPVLFQKRLERAKASKKSVSSSKQPVDESKLTADQRIERRLKALRSKPAAAEGGTSSTANPSDLRSKQLSIAEIEERLRKVYGRDMVADAVDAYKANLDSDNPIQPSAAETEEELIKRLSMEAKIDDSHDTKIPPSSSTTITTTATDKRPYKGEPLKLKDLDEVDRFCCICDGDKVAVRCHTCDDDTFCMKCFLQLHEQLDMKIVETTDQGQSDEEKPSSDDEIDVHLVTKILRS